MKKFLYVSVIDKEMTVLCGNPSALKMKYHEERGLSSFPKIILS
jgi:hypothetical protein